MANTLESTLNARAAEARTGAVSSAGQLQDGAQVLVPLDLLDDNPFQPRLEIAERELREFATKIAAQGLIQPIAVRPLPGGRFVTVAGHRRRAAFRLLHDAATNDTERKKYAAIPATLKLALDDKQLAAMGYMENVDREGLTVLEEARALDVMLEKGLATTNEELAALVKQPLKRVQRLRRLLVAPPAIKEALSSGVSVVVGSTDEGADKTERRRLDLMGALQLCRLAEHWNRVDPKKAVARIESVVRRALTANWSLRRIEAFVEDAIAGKTSAGEEAAAQTLESLAPLFSRTPKRFVVDTARMSSAAPEQLVQLREAFEDLLKSARGAGSPVS